jgi:hypothetical protein
MPQFVSECGLLMQQIVHIYPHNKDATIRGFHMSHHTFSIQTTPEANQWPRFAVGEHSGALFVQHYPAGPFNLLATLNAKDFPASLRASYPPDAFSGSEILPAGTTITIKV